METLPVYISIFFIVTTFVTIYFFWKASGLKTAVFIISGWLLLQTIISLTGFYKITDTVPPRFTLVILPPVIFILILFITKKGRIFIDQLDLKWLTILHIVRIPVELTLFALFIYKLVPGIMTFEGRNLDILSGITSAFVYYFGFVQRKMSNTFLIAWNIICLALLINIVVIAIFSAPFPFQRFGFDQPNVAILSFPFVWLPGCIVPLVLFSHLVSLRQLLRKQDVVQAKVVFK
jgi:hypothetical protein